MGTKGTVWAAAIVLAAAVTARAESDASFARDLRLVETAVRGAPASARGAFAAPKADPSIVRDQTTTVKVELNKATVKCSAADYSSPMLKVLIPGLAELTVLNHRNTREGAPCVAAGPCFELGPDAILKGGAGSENVPVRVTLKKEVFKDGDVCRVTLVENVLTEIRGVKFFHERRQDVAERSPEDCR
jgi:hypothetical protein